MSAHDPDSTRDEGPVADHRAFVVAVQKLVPQSPDGPIPADLESPDFSDLQAMTPASQQGSLSLSPPTSQTGCDILVIPLRGWAPGPPTSGARRVS